MDRNSPDYLRELSAERIKEATREWLKMAADKKIMTTQDRSLHHGLYQVVPMN